jgi:hypothetical protein
MQGGATSPHANKTPASRSNAEVLLLGWLGVGLPLLRGVAQTLKNAMALFR